MKASTLSICMPYLECDKVPRCPFCVSMMTPHSEPNPALWQRNLPKAISLAKASGVTSAMITGKGEPLYNPEAVMTVLRQLSDFPTEVQTNGIWLNNNLGNRDVDAIHGLYCTGLNVTAISIDSPERFNEFGPLFEKLSDTGFVVRLTLCVTDAFEHLEAYHLINLCKCYKVHQLLLRHVTIPDGTSKTSPQAKWIREHAKGYQYERLAKELANYKLMGDFPAGDGIWSGVIEPRPVRVLPHGDTVYDINGIGVSWSDYCVQAKTNGDDCRSIILRENGHVYTSWSADGSILF